MSSSRSIQLCSCITPSTSAKRSVGLGRKLPSAALYLLTSRLTLVSHSHSLYCYRARVLTTLAIVALFVNWLYTKTLPSSWTEWQDLETFEPVPYSIMYSNRQLSCIKAYALGDRLITPAFCRATNNVCHSIFHSSSWICIDISPSVQLAFSELPQGCVLLQKLIDTYCIDWNDDYSNYSLEIRNKLPIEFHRRTANKLHELSKMNTAERKQKRCYLEHANDADKKLAQRCTSVRTPKRNRLLRVSLL